jgi:DNA-binding transcriptional LysR family regulator
MSFLNLDLNLLRVFDAIMTEQNLTRASSLLAMTQPAVSNALKRLRDALGDELLIRTAHGMKPTARAEELWPTIRRVLSELEAAITPETFDVSKTHSIFHMAMADSTAALWLPSLVRSIEQEAPHMSVRMVTWMTRDPRPLLLRGDIDLAIGFFPGVVSQLAASPHTPIRHERLYTGQYVCVMRRHHPLAKVELTLDNYCAANHLTVSFSGRAHSLVDKALLEFNRERRVLLIVNQFFTAGRVVANSDLVTVLPRHLIASTGMTDALISKELPFPMPEINVDMLWHERDARSPAHKWLREHMSAMQSSPYGKLKPSPH